MYMLLQEKKITSYFTFLKFSHQIFKQIYAPGTHAVFYSEAASSLLKQNLSPGIWSPSKCPSLSLSFFFA